MRRKTLLIAALALPLLFAVGPLISPVEAQTGVFSEGFEGAWPGSWYVGDLNSASGYDYWGRVTMAGHTGSYSAFCAKVGDRPYPSYDTNMRAYMYRTVSLGPSIYSGATLSYWYFLNCENGYDFLYVYYRDNTGWHKIDPHTGYSGGWVHRSVSIPTTANAVGFYFYSDSVSPKGTGAWVDDVYFIAIRWLTLCHITVASPNGGESWQHGTPHPITWTSTPAGGDVKIELLKSGVVKSSVITANDGYYLWTIGMSNLGTDYRIRITSTSAMPACGDISDSDFAITDEGGCTVSVLSPKGGEVWQHGTPHPITWTSTSAGSLVKIELLKGEIVKSGLTTANDGYYAWTIGSSWPAGSDYRIRITSTSNPACTDTSGAFTMT